MPKNLPPMPPFIERMYESRDDGDRLVFGDHYVAPPDGKYDHADWTVVALYVKRGSDGQRVEIDTARCPAAFYRLRALPGKNSVGDPRQPFALSTGSGTEMAELMHKLALAISEGMVGLNTDR